MGIGRGGGGLNQGSATSGPLVTVTHSDSGEQVTGRSVCHPVSGEKQVVLS